MLPWLSDEEIADLCKGCKRNHERIKALRALGLTVRTKPNGDPIVLHSNIEAVLGGMPPKSVQSPSAAPDRGALIALLGGKNGAKAHKQPA